MKISTKLFSLFLSPFFIPPMMGETVEGIKNKRTTSALVFILFFASSSAADPPASWEVNPHYFEHVFTITSKLEITEQEFADSTHTLAGFVENECRGVTTPISYGNNWLFYLMVYGDGSPDSVTFKYYDSDIDSVYLIHEKLVFQPDGSEGTPDDPYVFHGLTVNIPPIADAGPDVTVMQNMTVILDGSRSYDPNELELSYTWTSLDGIDLTSYSDSVVNFTSPEDDQEQEYRFTLAVFDGALNSSPDTVSVTVKTDTPDDLVDDIEAESLESGEDVTISIDLPDYLEPESVVLVSYEGNESDSTDMTGRGRESAGGYSATVDGSKITYKGFAYSVYLRGTDGNSFSTTLQSLPVAFESGTVTTGISDSYYPAGVSKSVWRIISLPLENDNPTVSANIQSVMNESAGEFSWQLYSWDGSAWVEPETMEQGESYWFQQRIQNVSEFSLGSGLSVSLTGFNQSLTPGWNLVSSPYAFPVLVNLDADIFSGPYAYGNDGEGWDASTASQMLPWGGYAVYNKTSSNQILTLDPLGNSSSSSSKPEHGWQLQISALGNTHLDVNNMIGSFSNTSDLVDQFDRPEPPLVEKAVSIYFNSPDPYSRMKKLTHDLRGGQTQEHVWAMNLDLGKMDDRVMLHFAGNGDLSGNEVWLVDILSRRAEKIPFGQDWSRQAQKQSDQFPLQYKIVYAEPDRVQSLVQEILLQYPEEIRLAQNYPNPFNARTEIEFSLKVPSQVSLSIYDLMGRKVTGLVNEERNIGIHKVSWNGLDSQEQMVSSGIYFYVLTAGNFRSAKKLVLVK